MQQRQPRLGDILDDYCPRERRITNHAVVAMIEDTVKQTRCTTCDADHEYKQAKVPAARRKASAPAAHLVDANRVQAAVPDSTDPNDAPEEVVPVVDVPLVADAIEGDAAAADGAASGVAASAAAPEEQVALAVGEADASESVDGDEIEESQADREGWGHRPLIRATLPRPEGQTPERKAPDFTFRPGGGKFDANRNGQRHRGGHRQARPAQGHSPSGQGGSRFGGQRGPGQGQGGGPQGQRGNRPGQGGGAGRPGPGQGRGPRPGGGRKRGR
jgi:translation initiation factor IF-2